MICCLLLTYLFQPARSLDRLEKVWQEFNRVNVSKNSTREVLDNVPSYVQIKIKPQNNKKGQKVTTFTKHSYEMRQNLG